MAFTEDPSWVGDLEDRQTRWWDSDYAARMDEERERAKRARQEAGSGAGDAGSFGITPPAPPAATAPLPKDPVITYDEWDQPSQIKDADGNWIPNSAYGINPNRAGDGKGGNGGSGGDDSYDKWMNWQKEQNIRGAKSIIEGFLKEFGLEKLTSIALGWAQSGMSSDAMLIELRYGVDPTVRAIYDGRFPAMKARREFLNAMGIVEPKRELTEAEYLDLEQGIRQIASRAGIEADFLAGDARSMKEDGVTALIGGDVSLAEWRDRVGIAEEAANSANDETIALLRSRYGFGQGDIVSSFLNPELTKNVVDARREFGAAGLAAQSQITLGPTQTFSQELSEDLQRMNVQQREVAARLSPLQGLTTSLLYSGGLSGDVLGGAAFGTTAADASRVRRTQQGRAAQFSGDSGLLATREGLTGFGRAT